MTKVKGFLFTAGMVLATAFTVSCFPDRGDDGGGGDGKGNSFTEISQVYTLQNGGDLSDAIIWNGNGIVKIKLCKSGDYSKIKIEPSASEGDIGLFLPYQVEVIELIVKKAYSKVDEIKTSIMTACGGDEACYRTFLSLAESPDGTDHHGNPANPIWLLRQIIEANEKLINEFNCTEMMNAGTVKDGIFELKLPGISKQYLHNLNTDFECEKNTLSFSPTDVKGSEFMYFSLFTDNGEYPLRNVSINPSESEAISFAYLSEPLKITGNLSCDSNQTLYNIDANAGWNKIYRKNLSSISSSQNTSTTGSIWVLVEK